MSNSDGNGIVVTELIHDLYLRMLIRLLEKDGSPKSSISITLSTNSGVIYGHLITRETWKSLWADQMKDATGDGAESFKTFPDSVDSAIDAVYAESGLDRPDDDVLRHFVHLKDATLFVPGANRIVFPLWRGRLESVTGWSIGTP